MSIKVALLRENTKNINEMAELPSPDIIAAIAAGLGVAIPIVKSMFGKDSQPNDEFNKIMSKNLSSEKDLNDVRASIQAKQKKAAKIGLSEQLVNESVIADVVNIISQNPILFGMGAVALTAFVSKIKSALSSPRDIDYQEFQRIMKDAGIPSGEQLKLEKEIRRKKAEAEFKKRRAEYDKKQASKEIEPALGLPMNTPIEPVGTGISVVIPEKALKKYVDIMNRINKGESTEKNTMLQKLISMYGKENLDRSSKGMLYEIFKRFM